MGIKQDIQSYDERFGGIPKEYLERLSYLYRLEGFTKEDINDLLEIVDRLKTIEWETVSYVFYMEPKSTPRARYNPASHIFYVKDAKNHKQIFDTFKERHSQMDVVISTPTMMSTRVYIETPKGMTKKEKLAAELELIHHIVAPDWDNLGKTYCDMVQKTLLSNDSIVCKGEVEKFYSVLPRIEVDVRFMKSYDCRFNKRTVENRKSFKENPLTLKDIDFIIK